MRSLRGRLFTTKTKDKDKDVVKQFQSFPLSIKQLFPEPEIYNKPVSHLNVLLLLGNESTKARFSWWRKFLK